MRTPQVVIKNALQDELGRAQDNLCRAKMAICAANADKMYGESGQTLNQIIQGYQERVDEVWAAMEALK